VTGSAAGLTVTGVLVAFGTAWAFQRGAGDFSVFHAAWRLVLEGRGAEIYHGTPDRFLYGPGFAWLLSPLGLLPRDGALSLWCFAKAAAIGLMLRAFAARVSAPRAVAWGVAAWAVVFAARPLLIDFQYGQVNILILAACAWGLLSHLDGRAPSVMSAALPWAVVAVAAWTKLFPLPLLVVPFLGALGGSPERARLERAGLVAGTALFALAPMVTEGWSGGWTLWREWQGALVGRGFPTDSHNQSFAAFVRHYLTGDPTHVIAQGPGAVSLGKAWLSDRSADLLAFAWTVLAAAWTLGWLVAARGSSPLRWAAVSLGSLILPSHLIWKPYFVTAIPLAVLALADTARAAAAGGLGRAWSRGVALFVAFVAMNLTSYDFIGYEWAGKLEAASLMLGAHLVLLVLVVSGSPTRR
jgi:hypothetical protein